MQWGLQALVVQPLPLPLAEQGGADVGRGEVGATDVEVIGGTPGDQVGEEEGRCDATQACHGSVGGAHGFGGTVSAAPLCRRGCDDAATGVLRAVAEEPRG